MNRFNQYMNSHFSGCRLLAESYDNSRKRNVKLHLIPGIVEVIGVTDGTDAWMAPSESFIFGIDMPALLRRIHAGENVPVIRREGTPPQKRERKVLVADTPAAPVRRVRHQLIG